ncbi:MAG: hypothetical protein LBB47_01915 [Spirochaetaceae bacterium]|jgi:hypothetical protein|nr:hypothetical protein [Spirochaetaceae bacterium]
MGYTQIAVIAQVGAVFAMAAKIKNSGRRSAAVAGVAERQDDGCFVI